MTTDYCVSSYLDEIRLRERGGGGVHDLSTFTFTIQLSALRVEYQVNSLKVSHLRIVS